ncbi:hypothetical protein [Streptomyces sp. NPDC058622]|uniref:hypothetical protein n=1 Tax=Streptomyces sp. NPDC058622 TaxID=3346562 RepID=UPI00364EBE4F
MDRPPSHAKPYPDADPVAKPDPDAQSYPHSESYSDAESHPDGNPGQTRALHHTNPRPLNGDALLPLLEAGAGHVRAVHPDACPDTALILEPITSAPGLPALNTVAFNRIRPASGAAERQGRSMRTP